MNMISQLKRIVYEKLRRIVSENGEASISLEESNRLRSEWITRAQIEVGRVVMLPYFQNRGDGVNGHYCICRKNNHGYYEFWNEELQKWSSAGTVFALGNETQNN